MNDTKKFLLSLAMFMTAFVGAADSSSPQIHEINSQIFRLRGEIADLREQNKQRIANSLRRNDKYVYVIEHQAEIDSLRVECVRLIDEVCDIVRRDNKMLIVPHCPGVFMLYSNYPGVRAKGDLYKTYQHQIKRFEQQKEAVSGFDTGVKNHFDSIMHAEIDRRQLMIDSLLNKKMELIR